MRKVLPYFAIGGGFCLCGLAFFSLWRKLHYVSSSTSLESTESFLKDMGRWKKQVEMELDSQFERIRSGLGRIDREKRKPKGQEGQETPQEPLDEQGVINRALAAKLYGRPTG